jgi:hypothetical protein
MSNKLNDINMKKLITHEQLENIKKISNGEKAQTESLITVKKIVIIKKDKNNEKLYSSI